jgi:hypothetical protein
MAMTNKLKRIKKVQAMVADYYEPGNQSKSKIQAYRRCIVNVYPMSERTFWRYLSVDVGYKRGGE